MRVSKATSGWDFLFDLFKHQNLKGLQKHNGTYEFSLMISGDNAEPSRCNVRVKYQQDWNSLRVWQEQPKVNFDT
jgi:hypothetical protein